jgi:hypothetical protein
MHAQVPQDIFLGSKKSDVIAVDAGSFEYLTHFDRAGEASQGDSLDLGVEILA